MDISIICEVKEVMKKYVGNINDETTRSRVMDDLDDILGNHILKCNEINNTPKSISEGKLIVGYIDNDKLGEQIVMSGSGI